MNKVTRVLAFVGVVLLLALYGSTLFFAIFDNSDSMMMFKASIAATIIVPVVLWTYTLVYKLVKKNDDTKDQESKQDDYEQNNI